MLLFADGADHLPLGASGLPLKYTSLSNSLGREEVVADGRNGQGIRIMRNSGSGVISQTVPGSPTEIIVGFALRQEGTEATWKGGIATSGEPAQFSIWDGTTTCHGSLTFDSLGRVQWRRGVQSGTVLGTGTTQLSNASGFFYIEVRLKCHDTLGEVEVRVNGVTEILVTGADTRNGGTDVVNTPTWVCSAGLAVTFCFDDLYICDTTGTENNDFLGDIKVETVRPTGAGNSTQFTPSAGSNWQNVDEATYDSDTTYNASSTAGHKDTFAMANLSTVAGTVKGVQVVNVWRKDDAGTRTAKSVVRVGSTDYEGAEVALGSSYSVGREVIELNPATGLPWTIADVNALEAGYKVES